MIVSVGGIEVFVFGTGVSVCTGMVSVAWAVQGGLVFTCVGCVVFVGVGGN